MKTKVMITAAALLAASAVPAGAVSGGTTLPIAQAPFVAYVDVGGGTCSGTLISPTRVLTAAHCLDGSNATDGQIVVGIDGKTATPKQLKAAAVHIKGYSVDPKFGEAFPFSHKSPQSAIAFGDVGIVELSKPVKGITPVRVAGPGDTALEAPGTPALVVGYGETQPLDTSAPPPPAPTAPTPLQQGALTLISQGDCDKLFPNALQASMICSQDLVQHTPLVQACAGDSGGPVLVQTPNGPVQIGVTSWGAEVMDGLCGQKPLPDVAMRLSSFASFLAKKNLPIEPYTLRRHGFPTVVGKGRVGNTIACQAPKLGGDHAKLSYQWQVVSAEIKDLKGATGRTIKITPAIFKKGGVAKRIGCTVTAKNAGGRLSMFSGSIHMSRG